jgi:8-oxo-dGTP diphosphatase
MDITQTACALIYRKVDGTFQCLMTKRSLKSSFLPGAYELPGGHIESGETDQEGLRREIREELNLKITVGSFFDSFTYVHNGKTVLENIYLATPTSSLDDIKIQESEVHSYRWVSEVDVDTIVTANKNPNDPEIAVLRSFFGSMKTV